MRNRYLAGSVLALGLVVVVVVLAGMPSQAQSPRTAAPAGVPSTWPPHPERIVNICGAWGKPPIPLPANPNGGQVAYTVPAGQWFVLTDVVSDSGERANLSVYERSGDHLTRKLFLLMGKPNTYSSAVGVVFAPRSDVIVSQAGEAVNLTGYLVDR